LPGEVDIIGVEFQPEEKVVEFRLWNTRPYDVVLHPFYSQGEFTTFEQIYHRTPRKTFTPDESKKLLLHIKDEYLDFETEFKHDIYPEVQFTGPDLKILKPFEIRILQIKFADLGKVF